MIKYILILFVLFSFTNLIGKAGDTTYSKFLYKRINYITTREYSAKLDKIYIGLVNYPQWFVTLSTGLYNGLTMHKRIRGSESLYPTNVTQHRWMDTFKTSSYLDIEACKQRIRKWTHVPNLELVMYSQAMIVCLSSNKLLLDNKEWYNTCWTGYHSKCKIVRKEEWT